MTDAVSSAAFSPDGTRIVTASSDKTAPPDPPAWCVEKAKWPFNTAEWEQWLRDLQDGENPPLPAAP